MGQLGRPAFTGLGLRGEFCQLSWGFRHEGSARSLTCLFLVSLWRWSLSTCFLFTPHKGTQYTKVWKPIGFSSVLNPPLIVFRLILGWSRHISLAHLSLLAPSAASEQALLLLGQRRMPGISERARTSLFLFFVCLCQPVWLSPCFKVSCDEGCCCEWRKHCEWNELLCLRKWLGLHYIHTRVALFYEYV